MGRAPRPWTTGTTDVASSLPPLAAGQLQNFETGYGHASLGKLVAVAAIAGGLLLLPILTLYLASRSAEDVTTQVFVPNIVATPDAVDLDAPLPDSLDEALAQARALGAESKEALKSLGLEPLVVDDDSTELTPAEAAQLVQGLKEMVAAGIWDEQLHQLDQDAAQLESEVQRLLQKQRLIAKRIADLKARRDQMNFNLIVSGGATTDPAYPASSFISPQQVYDIDQALLRAQVASDSATVILAHLIYAMKE